MVIQSDGMSPRAPGLLLLLEEEKRHHLLPPLKPKGRVSAKQADGRIILPVSRRCLGFYFLYFRVPWIWEGGDFRSLDRRRKNTEEVGMRAKDERSKGPAFQVMTRHEWTVCHPGSV